jgi:hypothetical protein
VERIADVESAPEGQPLRQHVAECPRCQSLWLLYQSFVKADSGGASNIEAARRALEATIRRQAAASPAPAPRVSRMNARSAWPAWLRPAMISAAAAVLTVIAVSIFRGGGSDEPVLRGAEDAIWSLSAPQLFGDSIVLQWGAMPDADAYEVQLFDDALNDVYRSGPVSATTVMVLREALPSVADGATLTWRVRALRMGDVIATSPPSSLQLP